MSLISSKCTCFAVSNEPKHTIVRCSRPERTLVKLLLCKGLQLDRDTHCTKMVVILIYKIQYTYFLGHCKAYVLLLAASPSTLLCVIRETRKPTSNSYWSVTLWPEWSQNHKNGLKNWAARHTSKRKATMFSGEWAVRFDTRLGGIGCLLTFL